MANIEIRGVENLAGTAVPYAYAVKAGPWLFLTGHEAFDFAAGAAPEVEGPAGFPSFGAPRLKREAEYILKRMRKTLSTTLCSRRCARTNWRGTASSATTSRLPHRC